MAKRHKGKPKGKPGKSKPGKNFQNKQKAIYDSDDSPPRAHFTLRDELRNTQREHDQDFWSKSTRLWDKPLRFVSGGFLDTLDDDDVQQELVNGSRQSTTPSKSNGQPNGALEQAMGQMTMVPSQAKSQTEEMDQDIAEDTVVPQVDGATGGAQPESLFVVDTAGDPTLQATVTEQTTRQIPPSPPDDSSEDEEIVFSGRRTVTIRDDPPAAPVQPVYKSWAETPPTFSKGETKTSWKHADGSKALTQAFPEIVAAVPDVQESSADGQVRSQSRKSKKTRKRQNRKYKAMDLDIDSDIVDDYMANISDAEAWTQTIGRLDADLEWTTESSSEDDDLKAEARAARALDDDSDSESEGDDESEGNESSDLESDLEYNERERWEDNEDLRERQLQAMEDEEIARLLAKQEELGFGGDELFLVDDSGFGDIEEARTRLADIPIGGPSSRKKKSKQKGRKNNNFPDATLMADVIEQDPYGGFDIMDFERPSLRKTKKNRNFADTYPELEGMSDEELIGDLQSSWAADRNKKKQKKEERQELRSLGLLGGGGKGRKRKPDLSQRYDTGISLEQIRGEIKDFLEADHETQAFPPMDKKDRASLHKFAANFKLKSKSQGSGNRRFTILLKTQRTLDWNENVWALCQHQSMKGIYGYSGTGRKGGRFNGGGGGPGVTYRPGEIVGASAPEIASSSKGRQLIEKMGWAPGKALGKEGREGGLLLPVEAVIRSGRAGLG